MFASMKTALSGAMTSSLLLGGLLGAVPAQAVDVPVDLSTWTQEGAGSWTLLPGNNSVRQNTNGNPTIFYSDYSAFGNQLSGTIRVNTSSDNDFIGFVVGFKPGDLTAAGTNFLVIDWKQGNQGSFGCTAFAGLALSVATAGLANNSGAWCHSGNGVTELARGATLGNVGWSENVTYGFDIAYTASNIKVWVDDVLQFDLNGSFGDGRFGFYNYSQAAVTYAGITNAVLPPPPPPPGVPEPATWGMMMLGLGVVGSALRRQRRTDVAFS